MSEVATPAEVMAKLHYEFQPTGWEFKLKGSVEFRELSGAQKAAETLNREYGEGSHWIEALNETYFERYPMNAPTPPHQGKVEG